MLDIVLFIVGVLLGLWWWTVIILPLFYGIPKATYYILKGLLRKSAVIFYLKVFIIWNLVLLGVSVILARYFPAVLNSLIDSKTFAIGQIIGILISGRNVFTEWGRSLLNADFWDVMIIRNYCKANDPHSRQKLRDIVRNNFIERYGDQAEEKLRDYIDNLIRQ